MADAAYLQWHDDGHCIWASSVVHDDGAPLRYEFALTEHGYTWEGDSELAMGPLPTVFRRGEDAKAWAARTEFKWRQSSELNTAGDPADE